MYTIKTISDNTLMEFRELVIKLNSLCNRDYLHTSELPEHNQIITLLNKIDKKIDKEIEKREL
jgi:hypothetical protein